ncbi:MAG TPA: SDR family NAD(P)-dependent oxidoreductase, partial [Gemmatimonadaceae bacterium]|nr:SDR family NAD(P)-dependent oxidoreductase [Gemmatimonadaceae bacterium]
MQGSPLRFDDGVRFTDVVYVKSKFALVTGTSSGIGDAVARRLLDTGWHVLGVARRDAPIRNTNYEHCAVDLGDTSLLMRVLEPRLTVLLAGASWSRVGLVNNAAHAGLLGPIDRLDVGEFPAVLATNVVAPVWLMKQFLARTPRVTPLRIVNVSTAAAVHGFAGLGGYGSSKAALRMAGMVLAAELQEAQSRGEEHRDIAILSFEPGTVDTPMQENARTSSRET